MVLRRVIEASYEVLAVADEDGGCQVMEALGGNGTPTVAQAKMLARLKTAADRGRPKAWEQFHPINKKVGAYEFKTHELRVFCFCDGNRFICTHAKQKNQLKGKDYPKEERTVLDLEAEYRRDKASGQLQIID